MADRDTGWSTHAEHGQRRTAHGARIRSPLMTLHKGIEQVGSRQTSPGRAPSAAQEGQYQSGSAYDDQRPRTYGKTLSPGSGPEAQAGHRSALGQEVQTSHLWQASSRGAPGGEQPDCQNPLRPDESGYQAQSWHLPARSAALQQIGQTPTSGVPYGFFSNPGTASAGAHPPPSHGPHGQPVISPDAHAHGMYTQAPHLRSQAIFAPPSSQPREALNKMSLDFILNHGGASDYPLDLCKADFHWVEGQDEGPKEEQPGASDGPSKSHADPFVQLPSTSSPDESDPSDERSPSLSRTRSRDQSGKDGHVRRRWTPEEDELLRNAIAKHGAREWPMLARRYFPHRTSKQLRARWVYYLQYPDREPAPFSEDQDKRILELAAALGHGQGHAVNWSLIAQQLGDTHNSQEVKFRFRKLQRQSKAFADES